MDKAERSSRPLSPFERFVHAIARVPKQAVAALEATEKERPRAKRGPKRKTPH
jgi:hypothetical protein